MGKSLQKHVLLTRTPHELKCGTGSGQSGPSAGGTELQVLKGQKHP